MGKDEYIQTGLRLKEELNNKIESRAKEIGISKNAFLIVLIDFGFRMYENLSPQLVQSREQSHTPQCTAEQQIPVES